MFYQHSQRMMLLAGVHRRALLDTRVHTSKWLKAGISVGTRTAPNETCVFPRSPEVSKEILP